MRSLRLRVVVLASSLFFAFVPGARADYLDHFAATDDIGIAKVPHLGTSHILVLPLVIDDQDFDQGSEQDFLDDLATFYATDAEGVGFAPYYRALSLGRFDPIITVADPVHFPSCPMMGAYDKCEIPRGAGFATGDSGGAAQVVHDAAIFVDKILYCAQDGPGGSAGTCTAGGGVDLSAFDTSGPTVGTPDGVVDGIVIVSNAGFPGIMFPVYNLARNPLLNALGELPSFEYDGLAVGGIAFAGSLPWPQRTVLVSVHEFGHLLGFADLYNEIATATDMPYTVMGGWLYATPPTLLDPYSRAAIGWGHIMQASGKMRITLPPAADTGLVVKIGTGDEFFMIEHRVKRDTVDGDFGVANGVVVERVRMGKRPDAELGHYFNTLQYCVNCNPDDPFLTIEQADGRFDLEHEFPRNDAADLFRDGDTIGPSENTEPRTQEHRVFSTNLYSGEPTGITITVHSVTDAGADVEIDAPEVADACAEIADLCGDLPCQDGECGGPVAPAPPGACSEGCCCSASATSTSPTDARVWLAGALFLGWLRRRATRREPR